MALGILIMFYCSCKGQSQEFNKFLIFFQREIKLPIELINNLETKDTISKILLNRILFDQQTERAKFYSTDDKLIKATAYGRVPEELFVWNTWEDETSDKRITKVFDTKVYAIGYIDFNQKYHALLTKVIGFEKTYIDLYLFDRIGKLKSFVSLYEIDYETSGDPSKIKQVLIQSSVNKEGIIMWQEDRFNVKTKREYRLQTDGYFKIINQSSEGEFEY